MSYIGNNLQTAFPSYLNIDDISGSFDGVTTSFPLTVGGVAPVPAPLSSNQCLISVGGVVQRPDDSGTEGFLLSGGNIVFSAAPAALDDFFGVILAGADYVNVGVNFPSGTATTPSITFDTDLDTGIYNPGANEIGFTTAGVNRVTINSSGNVSIVNDLTVDTNTLHVDSTNNRVGIGTTSPGYALHVSGTGAVSSRTFATDATGDASFFVQNDGNGICGPLVYGSTKTAYGALASNETAFYSNRSTTIMADGGSTVIKFATGGNTERARIDSSGRLLVGTSSSSANALLTVAGYPGVSTGVGVLQIKRGSNATATDTDLGTIWFGDGLGDARAAITASSDAAGGAGDLPSRLVFSTTADGASSPTSRLVIKEGGDIVIPSASATKGLWIGTGDAGGNGGNANYRIGQNSFGVGSATLYIGNAAIQVSSDARLKENIQDTALSAVEELKKVRVVDFTWNDPSDTSYNNRNARGTWTGIIAQELVEVFPFAVNAPRKENDLSLDHDSDSTWTVEQQQLVPVLIKAIQEQQAVIADLQSRVTALEAQ